MKRKIYENMLAWKKSSKGKTALLIDGARRVGKSYIAEQFAKNEYKSYLLINFWNVNEEIKKLFWNYLDDIDTLLMYLTNYYGVKLYPRESLIIFDEIQFCPRARGAIKQLVADGRYDYMETGSLVSIRKNVQDILIPSEERHIKMYPMDFEEFLWATGNDTLMDFIRKNFTEKQQMGQMMHRKAMDFFRQYLIVGGMPQAVQEYVQTHDFSQVDAIKRDILSLYREDISKYAGQDELKTIGLFDEIPAQLNKHEKKFRFSSLSKNARAREYKDPLLWLDEAMIINICYNSREPNIGLKLNMERQVLKCYMGDTGLFISHAFDEKGLVTNEIYKKLLFGKLEVNKGMIMENIVAQMLVASDHKLYFYSNSSREDKNARMEIDFLIAKSAISNRHNISPIEVKSGTRYTLNSLSKFCVKYKEQLSTPYVLHVNDLEEEDGIVYLPIYMTPLL